MSTFATYNIQIEQKIANNSEVFFDTEMKRQAANDTIEDILFQYDIPEFIKKPSVTGELVIAGGKAAFPSDYMRLVKFWDEDANGVQLNEYIYLVPDVFDRLAGSAAYYWTEDYDEVDDTRKFFFKPDTIVALFMRYIKAPTEMTDDTDESGLSSKWDEAVAYGTAMRLFENADRYDEAREMERKFREQLSTTYLAVKNPGGIKENNRMKSKYERISQLGINSISPFR